MGSQPPLLILNWSPNIKLYTVLSQKPVPIIGHGTYYHKNEWQHKHMYNTIVAGSINAPLTDF